MKKKALMQHILNLRKQNKLHGWVEERISDIIRKMYPNMFPLKEPYGLAGGRNDLLVFNYSGEKAVFEVFASASQVSRDLRILDRTNANTKIAIIIDLESDPSVAKKFFRENPESNYPFFFISEFFTDDLSNTCLKLDKLIRKDEQATIQRVLNETFSAKALISKFKNSEINILTEQDLKTGEVTLSKLLNLLLVKECMKFGLISSKVLKLVKWFSEDSTINYIALKLKFSRYVFLYWDFDQTMMILSDDELLDLLQFDAEGSNGRFILSMNHIFEKVLSFKKEPFDWSKFRQNVQFSLGRSQIIETATDKVITCGIPKGASQIRLVRPREVSGLAPLYKAAEIRKMIKIE